MINLPVIRTINTFPFLIIHCIVIDSTLVSGSETKPPLLLTLGAADELVAVEVAPPEGTGSPVGLIFRMLVVFKQTSSPQWNLNSFN